MNTNQLEQKLKDLTQGLFYMSESDYPYEVQYWGKVGEGEIKKHIAAIKDYGENITAVSAEEFFNKIITNLNLSGDEALAAMSQQYRHLFDFIKQNSSQLKVWRCGKIEIDIYITMLTESGKTLALKTVSIET